MFVMAAICSKIEHGEIKRIDGMSSGNFSSLRFRYIYIFLLSVVGTSSPVDVEWALNLPTFFGNVAYLQCNISDTASNCANKDRRWIGGPQYDGLCYENECPISKKYKVMNHPRCSYILMIYNFSESDVNCEYTCFYGASKNRRNLTLDEKNFIYEPGIEDIKEETIEKDNTFNRKITIRKIYPKPSCVAYLNMEKKPHHLQVSITKPGFYYTADLQIKLPLSSCGKLDVNCYLGDHKINITNKNFDSCQFKGLLTLLITTN
ncbi:uncharacterized protein LOC134710704 [Mytilus trossulus]|uniref:uncharacterized protein LOC134710704 n=1 Tax=Mytilus trossulus TaxID=6551 RepID=UPI0030060C3C